MKLFLTPPELMRIARSTGNSVRFCRVMDRLVTTFSIALILGAFGAMLWFIPYVIRSLNR